MESQKVKYIVVDKISVDYPEVTTYYVVDEKEKDLPLINSIAHFSLSSKFNNREKRELIVRGIEAFVNEVNK